MSELSDRLWEKGFMPNPGEPWTLEDHSKIRVMRNEIERLEAELEDRDKQIESLQNKWASRELSQQDSDALEAENERLREALQYFYDYGYDRGKCEKALQEKEKEDGTDERTVDSDRQ